MNTFLKRLLEAERVDLAGALAGAGPDVPAALLLLAGLTPEKCPLTEHVQAAMDALLADAPPEAAPPEADAESALSPWWTAMPAAYVAAAFRHVGLAEVCTPGAPSARLSRPHARESVRAMREVLRGGGVPFTVREHAASLILGAGRIARPGARADETCRKLSCRADLRALYHLERAELCALGRGPHEAPMQRLEAFRERAERCGVFGEPCAPPLSAAEVRAAGFEDPVQRHRVLNALRYFGLVARVDEHDWFVERLQEEPVVPGGRLHLLIGPAGCGKSTWARLHRPEVEVVSTDRMREVLTGDPSDQSQNYLVFQRCMDRLRALLGEGRDVVFDATNYCEAVRALPVQAGRWSGAEISSHLFDVGLAESLRRNLLRPRTVPEDVIRKQYRLLQAPALYEADRQYIVDPDGRLAQYWPLPEDGQ
ncbi:MAG: AAA family ATPase [Candidatus Brocadiaceae bacterium]|nr:AAA family ATPase [Candidatus Brocadiaceae bacterium]